MTQQIKHYIISERLKYLVLGLVAGFFIGITEESYSRILIIVLVVAGFILSMYFWKKSKK